MVKDFWKRKMEEWTAKEYQAKISPDDSIMCESMIAI